MLKELGATYLEWELDGGPAELTVARLRSLDPQLRVVVLGQCSELEGTVLASGADAFVSKTRQPEELLHMLRQLAEA